MFLTEDADDRLLITGVNFRPARLADEGAELRLLRLSLSHVRILSRVHFFCNLFFSTCHRWVSPDSVSHAVDADETGSLTLESAIAKVAQVNLILAVKARTNVNLAKVQRLRIRVRRVHGEQYSAGV